MAVPQNSYLVIQAYGDEGIMNECAYALLTLTERHSREQLANMEIWIYTDDPGYFRSFRECWLNLNFRTVDNALISQWKGEINFVHRVKIEVLRDFVKMKQGQVLYMDTDVYFRHSIAEIFQHISLGELYMHTMEGFIHPSENKVFQKLTKYLRTHYPLTVDGEYVYLTDHTAMWNAGVIGFNQRYNYLLEKILAFTDKVYKEFPKHVVEQFAFSVYFQQTGPILPAEKAISHYWNLKELRPVLKSFFKYFRGRTWDELVYFTRIIPVKELLQEKHDFYKHRSALERILRKHWEPAIPNWELLSKKL
jgi:hypothetical protein